MGLIDKLTGKKTGAEKPKPKTSPKKDKENVLDMVKEQPKDSKPVVLKEDTGHAHRILKQYHLSEKTNALSAQGRYVFKVNKNANKIEIKKAVEKVYDVKVDFVNIVNISGKARQYGRTLGRTSDWKKAIVTLKAGEKISGLAEGV
jgi:large subunit ribosomal protein L23